MVDEDVTARLVQAQSKLLITDSSMLEFAARASDNAGGIPLMLMDRSDSPKATSMTAMIAKASNDQAVLFQLSTCEESAASDAFINRTRGSTGSMKSVLTTHAQYIAMLEGTKSTVPHNTDPEKDVW